MQLSSVLLLLLVGAWTVRAAPVIPPHKLIHCFCIEVTAGPCPAYSCHAMHNFKNLDKDDLRFDDVNDRLADDEQTAYYGVKQPHNGNRISPIGSIGVILPFIIG